MFRSRWSAQRYMPRRKASVSSNRTLLAWRVGDTLPRQAYSTLPYARMLVAIALTSCSLTRALFRPRRRQLALTALKALRALVRRSRRIPSGRWQTALRVSPKYLKWDTSYRVVFEQVMAPLQWMSMTLVLSVLITRSFWIQNSSKHERRIYSFEGPAAIRATSSAKANKKSWRDAIV